MKIPFVMKIVFFSLFSFSFFFAIFFTIFGWPLKTGFIVPYYLYLLRQVVRTCVCLRTRRPVRPGYPIEYSYLVP